MRFWLSAILLCFVLVGETSHASTARRLKFNPDAWVRGRIDTLVQAARSAYESDEALPAYRRLLNSIIRTIRQRKLSDDASFSARYREFVEYVQTASLEQLPGHELGFSVTDKQYFDETREYVGIPYFLKTQRFLRLASRSETLDKAKRYLRQVNSTREPADQLVFFSYKSKHLGTPDNDDSFLRLLVVVPGDVEQKVPEKWVQFGVTDPGARKRIRNVSVVSAILGSDGRFDAYFKDYFRTFRGDGSTSIKGRWDLGYGDDNCVRCHKTGILPIFPEEGSVSERERKALSFVNERLRTYGYPRFGNYLDVSKLGPGLGDANWDDRRKRFGEEFVKSSAGAAMTCANCHQRDRLGSLSWPMDNVLVKSYVRGGQMPFGYKLEGSERVELYEKLIQEYFAVEDENPGILKTWLLGKLRTLEGN